jgi:isocitrate/isopropylmalate dehydrogenase
MENVIAEGRALTSDVGGKATTTEMGTAVARAVVEVARAAS